MQKKQEYFILVNKNKNTVAQVSTVRKVLQDMLDRLSKSKPLLASEWKIESRYSFSDVKDDTKDFEGF